MLRPTSGKIDLWIANHPPETGGPTYYAVYAAEVPETSNLSGLVFDDILDDPMAFFESTSRKLACVLRIDIEQGAVKVKVLLLELLAIAFSI